MSQYNQPGQRDPRQPFGSRDPRQPFGQDAPPAVSTSQFAQPNSRRPLWITLAALALVALVAVAAIKLSSGPDPAPAAQEETQQQASQPVDSPAVVPSTTATPGIGVPTSTQFTNGSDDTAGTFEVISHQWTDQGLLLTLRVTLDSGQQRLGFFALDNKDTSQYDPSPSGPQQLDGRSVSAGQSVTGTVLFAKPQGSTTVFLTSSNGKQVAALKID